MVDPFTPIPNHIIDNMHQMKGSVFQIICAVARKTAGYSNGNGGRKEWDMISFSQFHQITGLSRPAINEAIHDAVLSGWIERREKGQSFEYKVVKKVNQLEELTSKESLPVEEPASKESLPELVKKVNTQKKRNKKKDIYADAVEPVEDEGKAPTEQQQLFEAICHCVGWDYKTLDESHKGQVAQTLGILKKAGYTIDDLRAFYKWWWHSYWKGKDKKQHPTIKDLRAEIGKVKANGSTPEMMKNGNGGNRYGMQEL
jgi:hypothetical protein